MLISPHSWSPGSPKNWICLFSVCPLPQTAGPRTPQLDSVCLAHAFVIPVATKGVPLHHSCIIDITSSVGGFEVLTLFIVSPKSARVSASMSSSRDPTFGRVLWSNDPGYIIWAAMDGETHKAQQELRRSCYALVTCVLLIVRILRLASARSTY